MKNKIKKFTGVIIAIIISIATLAASIQVGIWAMLIKPMMSVAHAFHAELLTIPMVIDMIMKCLFSLPVAAIILWSGYIIAMLVLHLTNNTY